MTVERNRRFLNVVVLLLVSLASGSVSTAPVRAATDGKVSRLLERGRKMLVRGNLDRARDAFEAAERKQGGDCAECALGLSHVARRRGEIGTAIEEARRATRTATDQVVRYYAFDQLALSLYTSARLQLSLDQAIDVAERRGARLEEALAAYDEAIRNAGSLDPPARCGRAEVLYRLERYEEARADLETCGSGRPALEPLRAHLDVILGPESESDSDVSRESEPVPLDGTVRPPVKISAVPPVYNEIARQARVTGLVILQGIIDREGRVSRIVVLEGLPLGVDWQAVDAIRQWRFEPATLNGRPVAVHYNLTVNFRLQ